MNVDGVSVVPCTAIWRSRHVHRRRPCDSDPCTEDGIEVLRQLRQIRHSVPTETLQTLVVALVLSQLDYGNAVLGLSGLPDSSSSVCRERLSTDDPPTTQLRPHNRHTGQSPLASHPGAYSVQGHSRRVQSASWTCTAVSRTTDSRLQPTWSMCTPFGWHKSAGHTVCSTVDCRQSGIRRCWPASLE